MYNAYKDMMSSQSLSEKANVSFYEQLQAAPSKKALHPVLKAAVITICICLLIPTTVFAVDSIFGIGLVEIVERNFGRSGEPGIGWDINFENAKNRPITDFAPKWQNFDGFTSVTYDSWDDAKADLGIKLADNSFLSDKNTKAVRRLGNELPDSDGRISRKRVHCYGDYNGREGQLCFSSIRASYQRDNASIFLTAITTAKHPTIPDEELLSLHNVEVTYRDQDVTNITIEQYTAQSGLTATITTIDLAKDSAHNYEATFVANGTSYRVVLYCHDATDGNEKNKAMLIDILEGFTF